MVTSQGKEAPGFTSTSVTRPKVKPKLTDEMAELAAALHVSLTLDCSRRYTRISGDGGVGGGLTTQFIRK